MKGLQVFTKVWAGLKGEGQGMLQYCGTTTPLKGLGEEMVHRSRRGGLSGMATPHRSLVLLEGYG